MHTGHNRRAHVEDEHAGDSPEHPHAREAALENVATTDPLDAWIAELANALDVDSTLVDRNLVLGVSRATHRVARGAAPLTVFLVGMAAGLSGGGAEAVSRAAATTQRLAAEHTPPAE
jgi:hypothetical protein